MHQEQSLAGAKPPQARRTALFGFTRGDLSAAPFIVAAFGAALFSAMGTIALSDADPRDPHAVPLLLFFPTFLFGIVQRRWTSLPLWACFVAISWAGLSRPRGLMEPYRHRYYLYVLCIVLLTEFARLIRGPRRTS